MNWRFALILVVAIISIPMLFMGVVFDYGMTHRQPATVTVVNSACQFLPADTAASAANGNCSLYVDDFQRDGRMVKLWLARNDHDWLEGKTLTLPADAVKMAFNNPKRPAPMWVASLPYAGMLLLLGSVVAFGLYFRKYVISPKTL